MKYKLNTKIGIATDNLISFCYVNKSLSLELGKVVLLFDFKGSNPIRKNAKLFAIYLIEVMQQEGRESVGIVTSDGHYFAVRYYEQPYNHIQLSKLDDKHDYQLERDLQVIIEVDESLLNQYMKNISHNERKRV